MKTPIVITNQQYIYKHFHFRKLNKKYWAVYWFTREQWLESVMVPTIGRQSQQLWFEFVGLYLNIPASDYIPYWLNTE